MLVGREEVDVPLRDEADQLAAHVSVLGDGNAREAVLVLGVHDVGHFVLRRHDDRVQDEALLVFLSKCAELRVLHHIQ